MSLTGHIVFYSTVELSDPTTCLLKLLRSTGVEHVFDAWRTVQAERGWDVIQQNLKATGDETYSQPNKKLNVRGLALADVASLYQEDRYLVIDVGPTESRFGSRVESAVCEGIPPDILGDFKPGAMYIGIGYHDLTDYDESAGDLYVARAFVSIEFFGYGVPRRWRQTRQLIFELPEIVAIKREFEAILGPLEEYAYWIA